MLKYLKKIICKARAIYSDFASIGTKAHETNPPESETNQFVQRPDKLSEDLSKIPTTIPYLEGKEFSEFNK